VAKRDSHLFFVENPPLVLFIKKAEMSKHIKIKQRTTQITSGIRKIISIYYLTDLILNSHWRKFSYDILYL